MNEIIEKSIRVRSCEIKSFEGLTLDDQAYKYCVDRYGKAGLMIKHIDLKNEGELSTLKIQMSVVNPTDEFHHVYLENDASMLMRVGEVTNFSVIRSIQAQIGGQKPFIIIDEEKQPIGYELLVKVVGEDESGFESNVLTWKHYIELKDNSDLCKLILDLLKKYRQNGIEVVEYKFNAVDGYLEIEETLKPFDPRLELEDFDCNRSKHVSIASENKTEKKLTSNLYQCLSVRFIESSVKNDYKHKLILKCPTF